MGTNRNTVRLALTLLAGLAALSGCAHRYLMKLTDGQQMIAISKPRLEGGNYHFRDEQGLECAIPKSRVAVIVTGAVEKEEKQPAAPAAPKKTRHWYLLWLG